MKEKVQSITEWKFFKNGNLIYYTTGNIDYDDLLEFLKEKESEEE